MIPSESESSTTQSFIHIAARVDKAGDTSATIGGVAVPVYETGVLVRDSVPLQPGKNEIVIEAKTGAGTPERQVVTVHRGPEEPTKPLPPSLPLFIDDKTVEPSENLVFGAGEDLEVAFDGAPGNRAEFNAAGLGWLPMHEQPDPVSGKPSGKYRATVAVPSTSPGAGMPDESTSSPVLFRLTSAKKPTERDAAPETFLKESRGRVAVWGRSGPVQMVRVKDDQVGQLSYGLTEVRLGGPFLAELTSGTLLRVVGRRGFNLKVELCPNQHAWIPAYQVEPAPPGTPVPHLQFTDVQVTTTLEGHEMVVIPYAQPAPFAIRDVPAAGPDTFPKLEIDLYGAHVAATWLSHRDFGKMVRLVTMEQPQTGMVRVTAHLATPQLWGYKTEVTTSALKLIVRKPPQISHDAPNPLQGLTIAVEAGHGGDNAGARGMTGSREADITLAVAQKLEKQLTDAGAKVVQTRIGNESVGLSRRAERAMDANADFFISIHCNSAGRTRGILAVRGNSTLYKHAFNHELATDLNQAILKNTGLAQFGVIGNFNYAPTRVLTWMPAVLVEQAFISNPEEEALMLNADFQTKMAASIREGMETYLRRAALEAN